MSSDKKTLYERLGGYDAITAVTNDLLPRLNADPQLGRFWAHRGEDGVKREKQLLIDFLCASTGGPVLSRQGHGAHTPGYAHQRERLERVPRSCRRDFGKVSGARGRTARGGHSCSESKERDRRGVRSHIPGRKLGLGGIGANWTRDRRGTRIRTTQAWSLSLNVAIMATAAVVRGTAAGHWSRRWWGARLPWLVGKGVDFPVATLILPF